MPFFHSQASIIEESGLTHSVEQLLASGEDLFLNIGAGELVLLLCRNELESVLFYVNAIERGVVPILMDADTDLPLIHSMVNSYRPKFIFGPSSFKNEFDFIHIADLRDYVLLESETVSNPLLNSELSLLLSTSGSTGSPKLVRLSGENLRANADAIIDYLRLDEQEKAITNLPMNYSYGLSILNSHLRVGAKVVLTRESVIQRKFWDIFKEHRVTSLSGVPYTYDILRKMKFLNMELPSLKTMTQAGGKLSNELISLFSSYCRDRNIDFFVMYGQTEATARLSYLEPAQTLEKLGSIGKAIPGGVFSLLDERGIEILEPNKPGELTYQGKNVMLGYAESRNDLYLGDEMKGTLKTGDVAFFDSEGYFYIVGRLKRFIKLFGNRINLDELEQLLRGLGVETACTGTDNRLIVYVLNSEAIELVKIYLSKQLGIHFSGFSIRHIQEIPKNSSGKTLYANLDKE